MILDARAFHGGARRSSLADCFGSWGETIMRFILGLLSGLIGMLAGWFGLALLVIALWGSGPDGGTAMGAFFQIGPLGGLVGLIAGIWLFIWKGIVRERASPDEPQQTEITSGRTRASRPFAISILMFTAGLAWWAWYELIRSPYLTHGFMTLDLQFRLPANLALPPDVADVRIFVEEGDEHTDALLPRQWHGHDGGRRRPR